jgi:lipoyl(octanoyl) transferase
MRTTFFDWDLIPYSQALEKQASLFNTIIRAKQNNESYQNYIIMCEHPHVYTLGRNGKEQNMLIGEEQLKMINATLYRTDRGGDITYHGPGQLVCYPILNLEEFGLGLKSYIYKLEEAVIQACAFYNLTAGRLTKATGVWMEESAFSYARKICAIGIRSSHYVTMHGLALNVNTDLRYFNYIHPCGFTNKGVTSIEKESGKKIDMREVKEGLLRKIYEIMV